MTSKDRNSIPACAGMTSTGIRALRGNDATHLHRREDPLRAARETNHLTWTVIFFDTIGGSNGTCAELANSSCSV
jgi:hypothetical protein